jgi:hypothetical protein
MHILAPKSVPFTITMVQVLTLALTHTKRLTVQHGLGETLSQSDYYLRVPSFSYQLVLNLAFAPSWATWDTC